MALTYITKMTEFLTKQENACTPHGIVGLVGKNFVKSSQGGKGNEIECSNWKDNTCIF